MTHRKKTFESKATENGSNFFFWVIWEQEIDNLSNFS